MAGIGSGSGIGISTVPALASAVSGIRAAQSGLDRTAARIARGGDVDPGKLPADIVEMKQATYAVRANVAVVKTADEIAQATLDLLA